MSFFMSKCFADTSLQYRILSVEALCSRLMAANNLKAKLEIIEREPITIQFLSRSRMFQDLVLSCDDNARYVVQAVLAIGQGDIVFQEIDRSPTGISNFKVLVDQLQQIEVFYDFMGGVVGYHLTVLKLIADKTHTLECPKPKTVSYKKPQGQNFLDDPLKTTELVRWGIESLPQVAEMYPLGGAGDRLNLMDSKNNTPLPAALFSFCGFTFLEGLIRDLQGREFLYYKLFDKQLVTPIAMMTSYEKNNRQHIQKLCEERQWFDRPKQSFDLFVQIQVPMVTVEGDWIVQEPLKLLLKPGGHGAIWKTAQDSNVFTRLKKNSYNKVLVRQINNPIAGVDFGLLAFTGLGVHKNKAFGFSSCQRLVNAAEGMNVLCKTKTDVGYNYCITNVEYTEFKQQNIDDVPLEKGSPYSCFPANTNILFADLNAIESALHHSPLPGVLVNMKNWVKCYEGQGKFTEKNAVRLESTMQNIANYIVDEQPDNLKTFITYNERQKTLSTIKQSYKEGDSLIGTPVGCFYDLMKNYEDLLKNYCGMELPPFLNYLEQGSPFIIRFHPAMGGLYSVIKQKIRGGRIGLRTEWVMEIAEVEIINLDLEGSLIVNADAVMGKRDACGLLKYDSAQTGKCTLINVQVRNKGLEKEGNPLEMWQEDNNKRIESLEITLHGNGEFFAENVIFEGNHHFDVADGERLTVYQQNGQLFCHTDVISSATWQWHYAFDDQNFIVLDRRNR